jgi:hypothetical protein
MPSLSTQTIQDWTVYQQPMRPDELTLRIHGRWAVLKALWAYLFGTTLTIEKRPWHLVRLELQGWNARLQCDSAD